VVKHRTLMAAASLVWLASLAHAEDKPATDAADPAAMFTQLDGNQDGQLTSDEIPAEKRRLFERLVRLSDKNGDGKLSRDEFVAGIQRKAKSADTATKSPGGPEGRPSPEKMFKRLDADGDGKLTLSEVPEPRQEMFKALIARADKDGDGALSEQEFTEGLDRLRGAYAGKPGQGAPPDGAPDPAKLFRRFDKDGDGKLALSEIPEPRRPMFERIFRRAGKSPAEGLSLQEFSGALRDGRRPPPPGSQPPPPGARTLPRGGLFLALDTDHDGKLSSAEISAAVEVLKKVDKNGDGEITIDELLPPEPAKDGGE
jgi:Ca2+-binding EF-hand superfamily protein